MPVRSILLLSLLVACGGDDDKPASSDTDPTSEWDDTGGGGDDTGGELWDPEWDEACNPMAMAEDCFTPFPSLYYTVADGDSPTGVRLDYSQDDYTGPDGDIPVDPAMFNFADGVSPVTPILVHLGVDVADVFLSGWGEQEDTVQPGAPIALMHAETGALVPLLTEMDQTNREMKDYEGWNPLIIRPLAPMEMGARYLVVLTDELTDSEGNLLNSPEPFVALRDAIETDDTVVEGMRDRYEELFSVAEDAGWERDSLLVAWEFQVASEQFVLGPIRSAREQALELVEKQGVEYTIDEVQEAPNDNVAWLVKGTFQPPSFLNADNELVRDEDDNVVLQEDWPWYDYTLLIPPQGAEQGDLPLGVIGHGLFGTGEWMLDSSTSEDLIHPIASEVGAVLVATDWIGLSGGDLDLIISEVLPDISRITVVTDRLVQSHVNTMVLVELMLGDLPDDPAIGREVEASLVDPDSVYYYGISLGGIQGAGQVSVSPRISRGVLAVPGAGWSHMIQRSTQFEPLETVVDALYPEPLAQNLFLAMLQTAFDFSDPANLGTLLNNDPTNPDAPDKVVVMQEAIGDCQVPNIATDLLSRALGASHLEYATDPVYGLDTITGPTTEVSLTQIRVPEDLDEYFPPDENTLPAVDNGVHNDAVLQEPTLQQAMYLFTDGEVIHPCDGECDPD